MSRRLLLLPFAAAAVSAACGGGTGGATNGIAPLSTHLIRAPKGVVLDSPVWLSSAHRLVVTYTPPGKGTDAAYDHLYALKLSGSDLMRLPLPARLQPVAVPVSPRSTRLALAASGVERFHAQGFRGQAIRLAIIDADFEGYQQLVGKQLPAGTRYVDITAESEPSLQPSPRAAGVIVSISS